MLGKVFGRYRITHKLGEGGMAEIWAARHELSGREAVVKLLRPEMVNQEQLLKRFIQEAQAASKVVDPGIVQVLDAGYEPDLVYMILERLVGETLGDRLKQCTTLPLDKTIALIRQLTRAMGIVHQQGIVHRDLKPDNLFLVYDPDVPGQERIKVLDFGLAKLVNPDLSVKTAQGVGFGTPAYMAPEQCLDTASVDHRADLYSIGCIFFRCLCGKPPFGTGGIEVMWAQVRHIPVMPSAIHRSLPEPIRAVIYKLLEKDPARRLGSCSELLTALDEAESMLKAARGGDGDTSIDLPNAVLTSRLDMMEVSWLKTDPRQVEYRETGQEPSPRMPKLNVALQETEPSPKMPKTNVALQETEPSPTLLVEAEAEAETEMELAEAEAETEIEEIECQETDRIPAPLLAAPWPMPLAAPYPHPQQGHVPWAQVHHGWHVHREGHASSIPAVELRAPPGLATTSRWLPWSVALLFLAGLAAAVWVFGVREDSEHSAPSLPAEVQDAAPVNAPRDAARDELERYIQRVKQALDARDWEQALEHIERARSLPQGRETKVLLAPFEDRAREEMQSRARLEELRRAIESRDLAAATESLGMIAPSSVYGQQATSEYQAFRGEWMKERLVEASGLADSGVCSRLEDLALQILRFVADEQGHLASLRQTCLERRVEIRRVREEEARALEAALREAMRNGHYGEASERCKSSRSRLTGNARSLCAITACRLRNDAEARWYFERLSATQQEQGHVIQTCLKAGIELVTQTSTR